MTAVRVAAENLAGSPLERQLATLLTDHLRHTLGESPSEAEKRSWRKSIPALARDLVDAGLGKVEMLLEYRVPQTNRRVDAVLAGVDPRTGEDTYLIVELKQWTQAESYEEDENLVLVSGLPGLRSHPLLQVRGYCETIIDFVATLNGEPQAVSGAAYLHNAEDLDVFDLFDLAQDETTKLFTKTRRGAWLEYLKTKFAPLPGVEAGDRLLTSAFRPSKQLMKLAAEEIKEQQQFVLIDEQRTAFDLVLHEVRKAAHSDAKEVVIVTGGPGSGKSVIALSLLGELSRQGRTVLHATGSRSFTQTMRRHVGYRSPRVKALFSYFNSFMSAERNGLEVLICDEAHRIRATSDNRYTKASLRTGRPQVDELIAAARVPVFLLDEHQVVKPGEIGTVEAIKTHAAGLGMRVHHIPLDGQFRCGGSRLYERWVLGLLGLESDGPHAWTGDDNFELSIAESPEEMDAMLRAKMKDGFSARISAGYCWPWSKPRPEGGLVADVHIDSWARPWNVNGDRHVGSAPPSALWATAEGGFEQVGCVYTAQGFEYDWSGVIIGPDLIARNEQLVTDRSANRDPELRKRSVTDLQAQRHIRNIYKVLLTRGMRGTVLYAVDPKTQELLASLIHGVGATSPSLEMTEY